MNRSCFRSPTEATSQNLRPRVSGTGYLLALALVLAFGLTDCTPVALPPAPSAGAPWPLAPGDKLRIVVFEQNQLGGEFVLDQDGTVSLPLVGRLKLDGLLPAAAEQVITERLAGRVVKNPKVNIDVLHYRPVYVYGEVTRPGAYEFAGNPTAIAAVTLAGGYTYRAQTDGLSIIRYGDPDRRRWAVTETTPIGPGDVIFVPERWF